MKKLYRDIMSYFRKLHKAVSAFKQAYSVNESYSTTVGDLQFDENPLVFSDKVKFYQLSTSAGPFEVRRRIYDEKTKRHYNVMYCVARDKELRVPDEWFDILFQDVKITPLTIKDKSHE